MQIQLARGKATETLESLIQEGKQGSFDFAFVGQSLLAMGEPSVTSLHDIYVAILRLENFAVGFFVLLHIIGMGRPV